MFIIQITGCMACYIFVRFKDSLRFSQSNRKHQGVNLSCLDRIYIDDFFVKKCGEIGIVSGSLFSNHAHVIMVVGKQPYHNNSCGLFPKCIYLGTSFRQHILHMWKLQNTSFVSVLQT